MVINNNPTIVDSRDLFIPSKFVSSLGLLYFEIVWLRPQTPVNAFSRDLIGDKDEMSSSLKTFIWWPLKTYFLRPFSPLVCFFRSWFRHFWPVADGSLQMAPALTPFTQDCFAWHKLLREEREWETSSAPQRVLGFPWSSLRLSMGCVVSSSSSGEV